MFPKTRRILCITLCGLSKSFMNTCFDAVHRHLHLCIKFLNTAWTVETIITDIWLALNKCHLYLFNFCFTVTVSQVGCIKRTVDSIKRCFTIICAHIKYTCRHISSCIQFATLALHIVIVTQVIPDHVTQISHFVYRIQCSACHKKQRNI